MELTRLFEKEDSEFGDKLFRHVRFKGGGGGGQPASTTTVQKADPWAGQQDFLKTGYQAAENRLNSENPSYYPGATITPFNANEVSAQNMALNYGNSGRPLAMQTGAENALTGELLADPNANSVFNTTRGLGSSALESMGRSKQMSGLGIGDSYGNNPALQQMMSGSAMNNPFIAPALATATGEAVDNFQNQVMPAIRSSQIQYQPGGSSRGDLVTGMAASSLTDQLANNATRAYMDAQNQALQQQQFGLGLSEQGRGARAGEALQQYGGAITPALQGESAITERMGAGLGAYPATMEAPFSIPQQMSSVGLGQREMAQQQMDESVNRHNFQQNIEAQKLANYMNLIQGNVGSQTTATATRGGLGLGGQVLQGVGTLGTVGKMFGLGGS